MGIESRWDSISDFTKLKWFEPWTLCRASNLSVCMPPLLGLVLLIYLTNGHSSEYICFTLGPRTRGIKSKLSPTSFKRAKASCIAQTCGLDANVSWKRIENPASDIIQGTSTQWRGRPAPHGAKFASDPSDCGVAAELENQKSDTKHTVVSKGSQV